MLIYLALAALYIYAVPVTTQENLTRIVTVASKVFFGERIGNFVGGLVAVSILGCLSATILTGPRIIYAMAKDGLLPHQAAHVHPKYATPSKAIWFHAGPRSSCFPGLSTSSWTTSPCPWSFSPP
jgi:APA family basic amino acid/polyamine antiporter